MHNWEDIKFIKNKSQLLVYLYLYEKGIARERDLKKLFRIGDVAMKKVGAGLTNGLWIKSVREKDGTIHYMIHNRCYSFLSICKGCKFRKQSKKKFDGKKYIFYECGKLRCMYHRYFKNKQNNKLVSMITDPLVIHEVSKNSKAKNSGQWGVGEFRRYVADSYETTFPGIKFVYNSSTMQTLISEMMVLVKRTTGLKEWRKYCKQHIDRIFKKCRSNTDFNIQDFVNLELIGNVVFTKDSSVAGGIIANYCKRHSINCIYFDEVCTLKRDNIKCTPKIRKLMREHYNIVD